MIKIRVNGDAGLACLLVACMILGVAAWVLSKMFEYSLNVLFGVDAPWYGDLIGGLVLNAFIVPLWVVLWILHTLCGVPAPFFTPGQ